MNVISQVIYKHSHLLTPHYQYIRYQNKEKEKFFTGWFVFIILSSRLFDKDKEVNIVCLTL